MHLDFIVALCMCVGVCVGMWEGVSRMYQGCITVLSAYKEGPSNYS